MEYQQDFEFHNASDSENERGSLPHTSTNNYQANKCYFNLSCYLFFVQADLELMLELPANDISDRDAPRILPKKKKKTKKKKMTSSSYKGFTFAIPWITACLYMCQTL